MMSSFDRTSLARFLQAVDDALDRRTDLIVIGGAAASLQYGAERQTGDIDTFQRVVPALERAVAAAQHRTGLPIPLGYAAVADAPWNFEERLQPVTELNLKNLRHDLALMKTIRGYQHDIEVIAQIHQHQPLDLETLKTRLRTEMSHVITDPRNLRINFLLLVEQLYRNQVANQVRDWLNRDGQARRGK